MAPMNARLLRPLATGFDPRRIAGLQLWFDYADRSTVLNSVSPNTPATDTQTVRRWLDKSGFARHANQETGANQPIADSGGMTFDGTNDFLDMTSAVGVTRNISYLAIFAVYSWLANPTNNRQVVSFSTQASGQTRALLGGGVTSGKFSTGGRRQNADSIQTISSSGSLQTDTRVVHAGILKYSDAAAELRINGVIDGSSSSFQTAGNTSDTDSFLARIGALAGSLGFETFCANVRINEILVYTQLLNSPQVSAIERYLSRKWGVALA
jgi:hypothetical protein